MFIWLASYPKSGNTMVRALLSSYFFSKDGIFDFEIIKNIKQFPNKALFIKNKVNILNEKEVIKNYLKVQKSFNIKNSIQFLKTHSYLFNIENNPFTKLEYSLGAIYIVRDPRNVVLSNSNHNSQTYEKSAEDLIKGNVLNDEKNVKVYPGTWNGNFNSWKSFKLVNKYLLIKYEDMVSDKDKTFYEILKFIHSIKKVEFVLNKKKFMNVLESTDFERMQKLENKYGFEESMIEKKTGKKVKFFNLGKKTNWKNKLSDSVKNQIEKAFKNEMIELGYL
tara:strand:+ start:215 stop:1048 length:834 start_codon:yes stop_codon:yes gene_type:complete